MDFHSAKAEVVSRVEGALDLFGSRDWGCMRHADPRPDLSTLGVEVAEIPGMSPNVVPPIQRRVHWALLEAVQAEVVGRGHERNLLAADVVAEVVKTSYGSAAAVGIWWGAEAQEYTGRVDP